MENNESGSFGIEAIKRILPHREPFLMVDRVDELVPGKTAKCVKAVSGNEWYFMGHFAQKKVMPGVLIVEAIAQAAGILAVESLGLSGTGKLVYFMGIEGAKFRAPIEPGCLVDFHVEFTQVRGAICKFSGKAMVDGKLCAEAQCVAMISDPPKD